MNEVAAFRPPLDLLFQYVEAANDRALERIVQVTEDSMADQVDLDAGRGHRNRRRGYDLERSERRMYV